MTAHDPRACCHRSADHCATGVKITGSRCCPTCAHDPRVTLTEAEVDLIRARVKNDALDRFLATTITRDGRDWIAGFAARAAAEVFADLIAARLAPIRALMDAEAVCDAHGTDVADGCEECVAAEGVRSYDRLLRAALNAPQDAPRGPVGGEQGSEVARGRSEGERPGESVRRETLRGLIRMAALVVMQEVGEEDAALATAIAIKASNDVMDHLTSIATAPGRSSR